MKRLFALLFALTVACGARPTATPASAGALAVRPVVWNGAGAAVGTVRDVSDAGDLVCVFSDEGATVLSAKAVVARDEHVKHWAGGDTILATDGVTRWTVGVDGGGKLWRLRGMSAFEEVGGRYGVGGRRVLGAAVAGPGTVVLFLDRGLAIAKDQKTSIFDTASFTAFASGGGFVAMIGTDVVDVVNVTNGLTTRYALPGVTGAALDGRGRLFATTRRAVYGADASGALVLLVDSGRDDVHGVAVAGDRVWIARGGELGIVQDARIVETVGVGLPADAKLKGSPSGDVWVLGGGKLLRYQPLLDAAPASRWSEDVAPVFARSCAGCHQPNGVSGIDLSTESAWTNGRATIARRVLEEKTMPPSGHPLSDADRQLLKQWLDGR